MTQPLRRLVPLLTVLALAAGCGQAPAPQSACDRYADLQASSQELRDEVAGAEGVDELRSAAKQLDQKLAEISAFLDQIQAASDGRFDQAITEASARLDEQRAALVSARYQAAETLGPQLEQIREDVRSALGPVKYLLDSQCAAG